jgi:hypothetical protein
MVNGGSFGFFDFVAVHRFQTFIAKAKIDIQNHSPHS